MKTLAILAALTVVAAPAFAAEHAAAKAEHKTETKTVVSTTEVSGTVAKPEVKTEKHAK
jgi:uncharacterized protein YdeI (BOF family)